SADENLGSKACEVRGEGSIAGDEERTLDRAAERIVRAEGHRFGRRADRGQPDRSRAGSGRVGRGERLAHTVPTLDPLEARLEEAEKPGAARGAARGGPRR